MNLPEKYRPVDPAGLLGQGHTPTVLQRMIETDSIPSGLLFSGASGTGKTTAARILATQTSAEALELDAGVTGSAAEIRALTEQLRYGSKRRVVIIDEAHTLSKTAFDALLKSLEDPPEGVTYIIVTTEPHKIPETIKTRTVEFSFKRVSEDDLASLVRHVAVEEDFHCDDDLPGAIAFAAKGSPRRALNYLQHAILSGHKSGKAFNEAHGFVDYGAQLLIVLTRHDPELTDKAISSLMRSARTPQVIIDTLTAALRDIQIINGKGKPESTGQALAVRQQAAAVINAEAAFSALSLIWTFRTQFAGSENPETDIRLLCSMLENILQPS